MGQNSFDLTRRRLFVCAHTGHPIVIGEETIDGAFASWGHLPSGWSSAELPVVDAVPFEANATLQNEAAIKGNIMLCIRFKGTPRTPFVEKVKLGSAAGAAAVIIVNTDDEPLVMSNSGSGYISDIPVLMIKSSDAPRLRNHGSALLRKMVGKLSFEIVSHQQRSVRSLPDG